ncbi:S49 family peptidase [Alishewanella sp. SMS8]|uniref:S49 family peptidase n=1 Tax=Alishewanella sp. SMS8 TaxID=2994676 RepID=UPI002741ED98|nr:S49 family peptidase [Alishewanella sp. SMS8]MDP5205799.1 S49 family peptidase [Alishewanella sp. SMS9]MDP5459883.1 S49 family peptidase [Alishewanella sp. SMS8]
MSKLQLLAASMINQPLLMEISHAKSFIADLRQRIISGDNEPQLHEKAKQVADSSRYHPVTGAYRFYEISNGVAELSVRGALAHKQGWYSWMMGYNVISYAIEQAISDPDVKGIYLDMHTPGGSVMGAFDCADLIHRASKIKPVWAIANDMNCSAGQLLASAASRRLVTQTGIVGSIGVVVAHTSYEQYLKDAGLEITLLHAGDRKVDGNPYQNLPKDVADRWQADLNDTRNKFANKVAGYTGMPLQSILDTEAATYEGQKAVDIGLADELVHSADGVAMLAEHCKTFTRTLTTGTTTMSVAQPAAAAATQSAAPAATAPNPAATSEAATQESAVTTPEVAAIAATASADMVIELCEQANMSDQIGRLVKAKLTEEGVKARLTALSGVRDTLAAANLSHMFADVAAKLDDPAAMLQVALTAATAHGEDREVNSSKQVVTEAAVKQPNAKTAYADPARL